METKIGQQIQDLNQYLSKNEEMLKSQNDNYLEEKEKIVEMYHSIIQTFKATLGENL